MIKHLAYTVPVLGRIAIGEITVKNGRRIPVRINHFKITAQHKRDGEWVPHPLQQEVANKMNVKEEQITEIPVRLMFNSPSLNMRERYEAFDHEGRILCAGDGENARRTQDGHIDNVTCPGPALCEYGKEHRCDLFARLNVQIDGQNDPFSSFILRTGSFNSVKTLREKMEMMNGLFGGRLVGVPFLLKLRQKSSSMSKQSQFFYVDLVLNNIDHIEAAKLSKDHEESMKQAGLDQNAFEQAVTNCLNNGGFEDTAEEFEELEEFILGRNEPGQSGVGEPDTDQLPEGCTEVVPVTEVAPASAESSLAGLRDFLNKSLESASQEVPLSAKPAKQEESPAATVEKQAVAAAVDF